MLDYLIYFDRHLFMLFNGKLTCRFLDWFMPLVTNAKFWLPFIVVALFYLLFTGNRRVKILVLSLILSVSCTDFICGKIIKKAVGRHRPCSIEQNSDFSCRLLLPKKNSKSFPSNHSANTAAFAMTVAVIYSFRTALPFFLIAFVVGFSRIYVGVHFPLDVLAGWILGCIFAYMISGIVKRQCLHKRLGESESDSSDPQVELNDPKSGDDVNNQAC